VLAVNSSGKKEPGMAERAERAAVGAKPREPAPELSAQRHEALERRANHRLYGEVLSARPAGPLPVQGPARSAGTVVQRRVTPEGPKRFVVRVGAVVEEYPDLGSARAANKRLLMERMGRARDRAKARAAQGEKRHRAEEHSHVDIARRTNRNPDLQPLAIPSPFGAGFLGQGRGSNQILIRAHPPESLRAAHTENRQGLRTNYTDMSRTFDNLAPNVRSQLAAESLAHQSSTGPVSPSTLTDAQLPEGPRVTAGIFNAIGEAEAHHSRVEDAGKYWRAGLRTVEKTGTFGGIFHSQRGAYIPGRAGGQRQWRAAEANPQLLNTDEEGVLENLSASSGDESYAEPASDEEEQDATPSQCAPVVHDDDDMKYNDQGDPVPPVYHGMADQDEGEDADTEEEPNRVATLNVNAMPNINAMPNVASTRSAADKKNKKKRKRRGSH
jgi:hypothetical protein